MKSSVINLSDIKDNSNLSLSASDYSDKKEESKEEPKEQLTVFKKTQPLEDIMTFAQEIQKGCKDFVVPSKDIMFGVYDSRIPKMLFNNDGGQQENFDMSDHAFSQMCAKIGVPSRFMKKCMKDKHPQIVADAVDTYLKDQGEKTLFVRANNDHVRGVLSEKFSVLDTPDILESIADVLPNAPVKGYYMTDERLHMRILGSPLNIPKEDLFWGIQIDSSDVGRSILKAQFMLYKQVCTNGLTVSKGGGELFVQKHIGITRLDFMSEFKMGLSNIPKVAELVAQSILDSKRNMSKEDVSKMITKSIASLKLDEKLVDNVTYLSTKYGQNRWGVVNALTELAQNYTLERRLEIEEFAGKLLVA